MLPQMLSATIQSIAVKTVLFSLFCSAFLSAAFADQPVKFDVPSLVSAVVPPAGTVTYDGDSKPIRVVLPASTEIDLGAKEAIEAFRFNVYWNRDSFPVSDYSPKNQTSSPIRGTIEIETTSDQNIGSGLHLRSGLEVVTGDLSFDVGNRESLKKKYQQLPEQSILVASGTSHRGTGVFFRFHHSTQETLEGGRELVIDFKVPHQWRSGVLKVDCFANGSRPVLGAWKEPFEFARTFVVPVYLAGDQAALEAATIFSRTEQQLRWDWKRYQARNRPPSLPPLSTLLSASIHHSGGAKLPNQWAHRLIQSGNDDYFRLYRRQLPVTLQTSAGDFINARQQLLGLR